MSHLSFLRRGSSDAEIRAWALTGLAKMLGERYAMWNETRPIDEVVESAHALMVKGLAP